MRRYLLCLFFSICFITAGAQDGEEEPAPAGDNRQKKLKATVYYGTASYYADKFRGRSTADGSSYRHKGLTAACNRLPLGTWIRVTNMQNERSIIVQINDRMHPKNKRIVDLSRDAAQVLGYIKTGLTEVRVEVLGKRKPST